MRPLEDLRTANAARAAAQASIEHADTKASLLLAGLGGPAALVADRPGLLATAERAGALATAGAIVLALVIAVGALVAGWHLGRCLAPRLAVPGDQSGNRFALPVLAARRGLPGSIPIEELRDQAWSAAGLLAGIAMRKYRNIQASLPWVAASTAGSLAWLCADLILQAH
ncbi:hypothetical protein AB0M46_33930 [Dactylosporangium sp. NPDC051485]|uniref:hypothetical protein n=1 Tax=Dactylosporangium sp. NPDC051485 TaxID=3154846 RepID=UPI00341E8171